MYLNKYFLFYNIYNIMENSPVYVLKNEIDLWKGFKNKPYTYFYKHYFSQIANLKGSKLTR